MAGHFSRGLFTFLRELEQNNTRAWFQANKDRYEAEVREPALAFIADFAPLLARISPHMRADPRKVGGSLFRIHRDTRFSKDKSPYKTATGIHFRHARAKDAHAPGFYLHLEPGSVFVGCGIWHPARDALNAIRDGIVARPRAWREVLANERFSGGFELSGDSLKRPPRGYDADHPLIEDLKRKDFIGVRSLTQKAVVSPDFLTGFADMCADGVPLMRFLCRALEVPF